MNGDTLLAMVSQELMERARGWDRLIPWTPEHVLFEDYLEYLTQYFHRNAPDNFNLHAAAYSCLEMEQKLSCAVGFTPNLAELSNRIKEEARSVTKSELESPVAAAAFLCIAEEAKLMSELMACEIKNREELDDFITDVLEDQPINFSNAVHRIVFNILTTYKGSCSEAVAASILAMRKEANILRELLKLDQNNMYRFARFNICESLRRSLRKFLIGIRDCNFPELPIPEPVMQSEKNHDMGSCPDGTVVIAVSSTPVTTSVTAPATAISCDNTLLAMVSRKHMVRFLGTMENTKEFEDVNDVPPLDIILYKDLMQSAWGWHRLLPWTPGYVPFKVYLNYCTEYLAEYNNRNTDGNLNLYAAACICLDMEKSIPAVGSTTSLVELSDNIKEKASSVTESDPESPVAAAGYMCIAEEAKLMSELLACEIKNREEDDFITEVLEDQLFNFSNAVCKIVFNILCTYKGPCPEAVAASMLGLKKEASIIRELLELNQNCMNRFVRLRICESLRRSSRQFLYGVRDCKFPELLASEPDKASALNDCEADHDNMSMESESSGEISGTTCIEVHSSHASDTSLRRGNEVGERLLTSEPEKASDVDDCEVDHDNKRRKVSNGKISVGEDATMA
ncbi:uncharacterized protein LOC119367600 isoform X1 [Triticum dicoccoides]|uniref:uncharacterized protein LOC119367600 isoform X1 n=2 Tax=Triticum dicoccoides TaxID=85692 RepID=UPI00188E1A3F|nr:uncharacterized protein LOC119367600 isoform X1 [Triticum dicoccoides]